MITMVEAKKLTKMVEEIAGTINADDALEYTQAWAVFEEFLSSLTEKE